MRRFHWLGTMAVVGSVLGALACSGADSSHVVSDAAIEGSASGGSQNADSGSHGSGGKGGQTGSGGTTASGGAAGDAGAGARDAGTGGTDASLSVEAGASDGSTDALPPDAPPCPSTWSGLYDRASSGSGCGTLDPNAQPQNVDGSGTCGYYFERGWLSGSVNVDAHGRFPASPFTLGTANVTCSGKSAGSTLTISCVGEAGTCTVTLTHQ